VLRPIVEPVTKMLSLGAASSASFSNSASLGPGAALWAGGCSGAGLPAAAAPSAADEGGSLAPSPGESSGPEGAGACASCLLARWGNLGVTTPVRIRNDRGAPVSAAAKLTPTTVRHRPQ